MTYQLEDSDGKVYATGSERGMVEDLKPVIEARISRRLWVVHPRQPRILSHDDSDRFWSGFERMQRGKK